MMPSSKPTIHREALEALACELVRTPSPSTQEGAVAELVAAEMRDLGYDEVRVDAMGNVIGRIGSEEGPRLVFNGHMDTIDVGDRLMWRHDPYAGLVRDGVLYGRGASDMKGGLAAMIHAAGALVPLREQLQGSLYVVGVVQEEPCEGLAMRHVVEQEGVRPTWVVLGEATNLQICRGQRGRMEMEVIVRGRSCHAAAPERGVNAIYEVARFVFGMQLLAPQLPNDSFLGRGTIAATGVRSEAGSHNVIPDCCVTHIDRRLTIGETETKALTEIRRILTREAIQAEVRVPFYRSISYTGFEAEGRKVFPYWITPDDDPLLRQTAATIENVLGYLPRLGRWDFSTDGVYTMGVAGIPTIGFGPGEERHTHTVEDQVRLADVYAAAQVYAQLALRMLR